MVILPVREAAGNESQNSESVRAVRSLRHRLDKAANYNVSEETNEVRPGSEAILSKH
ncbi:MAG: hypothetical protein IPM96_20540 [Ignavibacteria bacterium]|nr:hypothetical protein [Ignavibacteria bacterium]